MSVGIIFWGRYYDADGGKITVPAPSTEPGSMWLWDLIRSNAPELGQTFDFVMLPPHSLTQSGTAATGDGYGIIERRNYDNTRYGGPYGTEGLMAMMAALKANGMTTVMDLVLHQFAQISTKYPNNRRGAQTPGWFRGQVSWNNVTKTWNDPIPPYCLEDDVPVRVDDLAFGIELSRQHCDPPGVVEADDIDYVTGLAKFLDDPDFRFDDTKGTHAPSVRRIMDSVPNSAFVSEYDDGNKANIDWWANSAPISGRSEVEDFPLHYSLMRACNGFDATQLGDGYWNIRPDQAVGFVDNPDTDTSPGQQVVFNKGIAYAYMLTLPLRRALIYGKDYMPASIWPGSYGLKNIIDNLCWISRMFAIGAYAVHYVDKDVYVSSRDGNGGAFGWSGGLCTIINFNTLYDRTITFQTPFGANRQLHDYTGHMKDDVWTDANGNLTFTAKSNAYSAGISYNCLSPASVNQPVPIVKKFTTQTFVSGIDLKVLPVKNNTTVMPWRIYCAKDCKVSLKLTANITGKGSIAATVNALDGTAVSVIRIGPGPTNYFGRTLEEGWHRVFVEGINLPEEGANFELAVTYTGA
jgi:alpha-amylase